MARHSTATLTYPFTRELVDIDEMLVDLIQEVWRAGIETVSCCEDAEDISELLHTAFPHLAARGDTWRIAVTSPSRATGRLQRSSAR